jgi:hypothetical protein
MPEINVWLDNDPGDHLLIDAGGQVQGISGNTEFWDMEEAMPSMEETDQRVVVKVVETLRRMPDGTMQFKEWDYASEECPDCMMDSNVIVPNDTWQAICAAIDDADSFYEMFDGWEGVPERMDRMQEVLQLMLNIKKQGGLRDDTATS